MAVRMELSRIFIREMTDMQIIELTEVEGERTFPIVIGLNEAFAIERRLKGIDPPRPQTHELLDTIVEQLGGQLREIIINDLSDRTFFAKLIIEQNGREVEIDARPSDAIALGVARNVPMFVAEHVLVQTEEDETFDAEFNGEYDLEDDDDDDDEGDWS